MGHWLAKQRRGQESGYISRFDPVYWTVNFPRPVMASVVTTAPDAMRADVVFYDKDQIAGLIWDAEDTWSHPLLTYETRRDFRDVTLRFRWRSGGIIPLDQLNGPVLTIEGRDASGSPRTWFVRLWNYASGTPTDAVVEIDFTQVAGGFLHPSEADPVFAGDVDRMFFSLVPPGYDAAGGPLAAPVEGWAEISGIRCDGPGSVLEIGDVVVPEHGLRVANGYDDTYNLTPERLLRNVMRLGYRGTILHYVGMSHYFRLARVGDAWLVDPFAGPLNVACVAWHRDFAARAQALGLSVIWSLSYELLDRHNRVEWKQRAHDGAAGLTGWDPPSSLLSPANSVAMNYLKAVAAAFVGIAQEAGMPVRFQVGEPWWWTRVSDGAPCLYDDAARAAFGGSPVTIPTLRGALSASQKALLDQAGAVLAASTASLVDSVRTLAPGAELLLLTYLPTVLDPLTREAKRANMPVGWAYPAFDTLQIEDYDWTAAGNVESTARGVAAVEARLGYSTERQHFLSGFVLLPEDARQWPAIAEAADAARGRGVAETFVWALPQVLRDGFVHFDGEDDVQAFDDVLFPLALGKDAEVAPGFSTAIVTSAGGHEARNASWAEARTSYDVGPGVRSEADIATLLGFFRARMGPARGFRLRDPFDSVSGTGANPSPVDELLGSGDGVRTGFALVKHYGGAARRITRPVAGSVRVAVDGVEMTAFSLGTGGVVALDVAPLAGKVVTAGFRFDVAVRFAEDRLSVNRQTFLAGAAPSVALVEVREA